MRSKSSHACSSSPLTNNLIIAMSSTTTATLKPNIGVYTDPNHSLYIDAASPSLDEIQSDKALKEGEVLLEMKATGICGYATSDIITFLMELIRMSIDQTSTSGNMAGSVPP